MKTNEVNKGVMKVSKIVHERGDASWWGAEDDSLKACVELVEEVVESGRQIMEKGFDDLGGHEDLTGLLQQELGLEPDYIEDLWL